MKKKPEGIHIRGLCVECEKHPQTSKGLYKGKQVFRATCNICHKKRYRKHKAYTKFKKDSCEECGFVPVHSCQLDVDHINGDHGDDSEENLRTLCANCHRLKTYLNKDWE